MAKKKFNDSGHESLLWSVSFLCSLSLFVVAILVLRKISTRDTVAQKQNFAKLQKNPQIFSENFVKADNACIPYIEPADFSIGIIPQKVFKSANLCNDKVLYPLSQLEVDYGSKMPEKCACTQNIQPP